MRYSLDAEKTAFPVNFGIRVINSNYFTGQHAVPVPLEGSDSDVKVLFVCFGNTAVDSNDTPEHVE